MNKFYVNDIVKVTNSGLTYSCYDVLFRELGFNNIHHNMTFGVGTIARVFACAIHKITGVPLCAIVDADGNESLIEQDGIEKLTFPRKQQSVELTLDQIAEKFGIDASLIKIKK